jgi:5-(aminomethyl)-3-furanmethanol phosphate kinase
VVKLGGSLLDLPDLAQRLDQLRPEWGPRPLLVVGGGVAADLVRAWDQLYGLGEERAHWLALDSLALTARLLASLWPAACVTQRANSQAVWGEGRIPLAIAREWFEDSLAAQAPTPPHSWQTTTDTIAAWIASNTRAEALWLLKSVPCAASVVVATQLGLVDPHFAEWTPAQIPIHWANLRQANDLPIPCWLIADS